MESSFRRARRGHAASARCSRACSIAASTRPFRRADPPGLFRVVRLASTVCTVIAAPGVAMAQTQGTAPAELLARPITLIIAIGLATLLPFAFMTLTAFVKISTVLQIVRGAIGAQSVPTNTVVMAFAGALTVLAMAPVGSRIAERAGPLLEPTAERETASWVLGMVDAT